MKRIGRRHVLRSFGGATIALPLLDVMGQPALVRAESPITKMGPNGTPKRFVVFFTPCGQGADWLKNSNGPDGKLVLAPALKPLERHKDRLLFLDGINNLSALFADGASIDPGHLKPILNLMTAVPSTSSQAGGTSIDQAIAAEIGKGTRIPSLQLSVQPKGAQNSTTLSWARGGVGLSAISDPLKAFTRLFSDAQTTPTAISQLQAERKSVLDGVKKDYGDFLRRLGGTDRVKLEAHFEGIREVETRLPSSSSGSGCNAPERPKGAPGYSSAEYATVSEAQMGLAAAALACDTTRVITLMWQGAGGNIQLPGFNKGLHDASHDYGPIGWPLRNRYTEWHATLFAKFLDKLVSQTELGRPLLDNTVFYWCSEHGAGNHNYDWMTFMIAGSGGGYFKTGRQISYPNGSDGLGWKQYKSNEGCTGPGHGDLYVSFLNAMGIPGTTFGKPDLCKGPLPGLTA